MTRAIWIDAGQAVNVGKLRNLGITAPYFPHTDPNITAPYLQSIADQGFQPGIYSAWNWYPDLPAWRYADLLSNDLKRIGWPGNPPVCVDIETHDMGYVREFLARWRRLRPTRPTWWTFEGFQGALFETSRDLILKSKVRLAPQFYRGDMTPHEHSPVLDLLISGFPGELIDGMYDAAALPWRWRGFAFTQQRLP